MHWSSFILPFTRAFNRKSVFRAAPHKTMMGGTSYDVIVLLKIVGFTEKLDILFCDGCATFRPGEIMVKV